ncbi:metal-sensitive transcriptional regulator [Geomesophilobacter sediminis]|uniref:Metal-sensitive transcriptional regulator n=1 Tax=Geomesophilobacter sediminis TaxID=2798584 RepID=A0A8J7LTR8_9BACT|nr:metal-sensitive transcriptional regulator [Geomesophilobacter sediminis]MBJ6723734.1 metal-sensitive transcriptional regulator [Geomesophilobacter sediminis]
MSKDDSCPTCGSKSEGVRKSNHDEKTVRDLVNRMNRIEGQVRGIKGMIERQVYCDDILHQVASVESALHGVAKLLLEKHMKSCVTEQLKSGGDQVVDEVITTIFKLIK